MKRILVLGGTGRTGQHIIDSALAAGMGVNVLARRPEAVTQSDPNLTVFAGTPENMADITPAMAGVDAVLCTLNNNRASDSPFAKIVNSPTLLTDIFKNVTAAMKDHNVQRIVQLGASGAGDSFAASPWILRLMIRKTNLGVAYSDHEGVEAVLANSGLDWTVARAAGLSAKTGAVKESYVVNGKLNPKPSMLIGRESVAKWMVDAVERTELFGKSPTISAA